jgi:hypothetical protein
MTTLLKFLFLVCLTLFLVSVVLPVYCPDSSVRRDYCPVSGKPVTQRNLLRHKGKCYHVGTCTKHCHEVLQEQAKDEAAFSETFSLLGGYSAGSPGLHVLHPSSKEYLQFAKEAPCER